MCGPVTVIKKRKKNKKRKEREKTGQGKAAGLCQWKEVLVIVAPFGTVRLVATERHQSSFDLVTLWNLRTVYFKRHFFEL